MSLISEFKKFALRGNVMDMAVGIIIGGAFGTVVKSLVDDIIMPPIGMLTSGIDFKNLASEFDPPMANLQSRGNQLRLVHQQRHLVRDHRAGPSSCS